MNYLSNVFQYYDQLIAHFNPTQQAIISFALLLFLIWQLFMIFKSGHWIFIALLIILLPGTWPAALKIFDLVWIMIKFLFSRAQLIFS